MRDSGAISNPAIPIAARMLTLRDGDRDVPVEIRIFAPLLEADGSWGCGFEIGWPERPKEMTIYGVDAMQALVLALQAIGVQLYTSEYRIGKPVLGQAGQRLRLSGRLDPARSADRRRQEIFVKAEGPAGFPLARE